MSRLRLAAAGIASLAILGTAAHAQEGQGRRPDAAPSGAAQEAPQQGKQGSTQRAPGVSNQERGPSARGVERGNAERAQENRRGPSDRGVEKSAAGKERATEKRSQANERRGDNDKAQRSDDNNNRRRNTESMNADRKKMDSRRSDEQKAQSKRTAEPKANMRDGDRTKAASPANTTKGERDRNKAATSQNPKDGKTAGRTGNRERIQLTEQQRTTLRDTIIRERPQRVTNVNINIRVGERFPRSVRLRPLPVILISAYPAYRDYRYVYIRDEICIVDPVTYEIVEVVDARDGGRGVRQAELSLTGDDQRFVYQAVIDNGPRLNLNLRLGIGAEVPRSVEVQSFPERVIARVPRLANYRFVIDQDQVVVLSPSDYQIAVVISR